MRWTAAAKTRNPHFACGENWLPNLELKGVPRVVVEIGFKARSRGASIDATMTEYPASTISPWYKSWVEGEKDRHKRFPSSTPRDHDPSVFYASFGTKTFLHLLLADGQLS